VSVRFYRDRDDEAAPAMVIVVFDPPAWLKHRARRLLRDIDRIVGRTGAYYVGLVDIHGRFVWETGHARSATGFAGGVYAPADIDSCQPVQHSLPVAAVPLPPCVTD
jgi:hypothetical protein